MNRMWGINGLFLALLSFKISIALPSILDFKLVTLAQADYDLILYDLFVFNITVFIN